MKIDELRIGSLISYRGEKEGYVSNIGSKGFETCRIWNDIPFGSDDIEDYEPIPLTEEWLLKFGFRKINASGLRYYNNGYLNITLDFSINFDAGQRVYIKTVHQLQNLYFALTGKELEYDKN